MFSLLCYKEAVEIVGLFEEAVEALHQSLVVADTFGGVLFAWLVGLVDEGLLHKL